MVAPSVVVQNGSMRPDFVPADPDYTERVRASFDAQAMMNTLGVSITGLGPGWIDLEFDHDEGFTQQHGFKHAGAIARPSTRRVVTRRSR